MKQLIIILLILSSCISQAQVAYLYSEVDSVLIGESFDVSLVITGLAAENIESVSWDTMNNLEHRSLIDSQLYNVDYELNMGKFSGEDKIFNSEEMKWQVNDQEEPHSISNVMTMTVWELCILGIPGPTVTLTNGQEFTLSPKYIYVKDPLLREVEGLAPSEDIIREVRTWLDIVKENWILIVGILLFFILVPLAVWFSRRKQKEVEVEEVEPEVIVEPKIPPHIVALERLNELKNSKVWEAEDDKKFVSKLTDIIREYIEERFGVKALEMTSQEIADAMRRDVIDTDQMHQLQQTLDVSDLIKFAKAKADANMYEKFVDDAIDLVDSTKEENEES